MPGKRHSVVAYQYRGEPMDVDMDRDMRKNVEKAKNKEANRGAIKKNLVDG